MERNELKQKDLARQAGVSQSYISQLCTGKKLPTIPMLNRLGECLHMSVTDFLEDGEEPIILTEDEKRLVKLYRAMDSKGRAVLTGIVNSV